MICRWGLCLKVAIHIDMKFHCNFWSCSVLQFSHFKNRKNFLSQHSFLLFVLALCLRLLNYKQGGLLELSLISRRVSEVLKYHSCFSFLTESCVFYRQTLSLDLQLDEERWGHRRTFRGGAYYLVTGDFRPSVMFGWRHIEAGHQRAIVNCLHHLYRLRLLSSSTHVELWIFRKRLG